MNNLTHINSFKYHMYNLIFFFVNVIFIRFIYQQGLLGEISENLNEITMFFLIENILNPIDILFLVFAVSVLIFAYKKKEYSIIEMKPFRIIFITIIIIGVALLLALLLILYLPMLFNYCYVECANKLQK